MNLIQHSLVLVIRGYRLVLSPAQFYLFGASSGCRFTPTCSVYALEAISTHGAGNGSALAVRRICRCHPWGTCGHDPVPPLRSAAVPGGGFAHRLGADSFNLMPVAARRRPNPQARTPALPGAVSSGAPMNQFLSTGQTLSGRARNGRAPGEQPF